MLFKLPAERNDFINALQRDFQLDELEELLLARLDVRLNDVVIPHGISYRTVVERVVLKFEDEDTTWELIRATVAARPQGPNVRRFLARHPRYDTARRAASPIEDPLRSCFMRAGRIMIDRDDLRERLRLLRDEPAASRILVVTGDRATGKSYSRELVSYLASCSRTHRLVYIDLDKYLHEEADLAEAIACRVGLDTATMPPRRDAQRPAWIAKLADWLISHMVRQGNVTYWCVLDGFREHELLSHTKDLIDELAVRAEEVSQCRILLLNYVEALPPMIDEYVCRDETRPVGREELIEFLGRVNAAKGDVYPPGVLEEKADVILEQVAALLVANPERRLERLHFINVATSETIRELYP